MIFSATYHSSYLLAPSVSLPPITFSGVLTAAAVPSVTYYFESSIVGDSNPNNNYSTITSPVLPAFVSKVASLFGPISFSEPQALLYTEKRKWRKCTFLHV
jgi:hypothetical protein